MDMLSGLWESFSGALMKVLPKSPFQEFLADIGEIPFLGYLNWFFPVGDCIKVMIAWCGAIALFQFYSIVMRWLKMIGD